MECEVWHRQRLRFRHYGDNKIYTGEIIVIEGNGFASYGIKADCDIPGGHNIGGRLQDKDAHRGQWINDRDIIELIPNPSPIIDSLILPPIPAEVKISGYADFSVPIVSLPDDMIRELFEKMAEREIARKNKISDWMKGEKA